MDTDCYEFMRQALSNLYYDDENVSEGNGLHLKRHPKSALLRSINMDITFLEEIILL